MNILFLFTGILILAFVIIDVLWTTIWIDGGSGPLTKLISHGVWKLALKIGRAKHGFLSVVGPLILIKTAMLWFLFLWLGWTLIFLSQDNAITGSTYFTPSTISDNFWYTGYMLLTVGNGDYKPTGVPWKILSTLVAFSGMTLITLAVTYFLSVVSAVVNKKSFACQLFSIGSTPEDMFAVLNKRDDYLSGQEQLLNSIGSEISRITQQYKAYPILRFYHANDPEESELNAVAILDEVLTLMSIEKPQIKQDSTLYKSLRRSVDTYVQQLGQTFEHTANEAPPLPDFKKLYAEGLLLNEDDFKNTFESLKERRKKILGLLHSSGWSWHY